MANRVMGEVSLEIAGEPRVLDFTFETFEAIGQQIGSDDFVATIKKIGADLSGEVNFKTLWVILAEALRENWPEVSVAALRKSLRPRDMPKIVTALNDALQAALPEEEKR